MRSVAWRVVAGMAALALPVAAADTTQFQRVPLQYIAVLAAPDAKSGGGAQRWGLWPVDPGPRGVKLGSYEQLVANGGVAPEGWKFDAAAWWLEENGLIMEPPLFPLAPGRYVVTGDRDTTAVLTVQPADEKGDQRWELDSGATIHDVTHLACRSARYTPAAEPGSCTPARAPRAAFRVKAGAPMPAVEGCAKQDYAVLIVVGVAVGQ